MGPIKRRSPKKVFKYILKRLIQTLLLILGVTLFVFVVISAAPGNPAQLILGQDATPENVANLEHEMGLDQPLLVQYGRFITSAVRGDLGTSFRSRRPVTEELSRALPISLHLAAFSVAVSALIGVVIGVISAVKQRTMLDDVIRVGVLAGVSVPQFWLGLVLIYYFSVHLRVFPSSGWGTPRQMILPILTLATFPLALFVRITRSSMLEVIRQDYVRTARAKGLLYSTVIIRHALGNALIPVVTVIGLQAATLIGGSVMTETVFSIPGLGRMLINGIYSRDYPVVRACTMVGAAVFALINLFVDVMYSFLDPRITYE